MSDVRLPALVPAATPARPPNPARLEAVRAAQRAFFETALAAETQAPPAPAAAAPATGGAAEPSQVHIAFDPAAPEPTRPLRPGSLVDIRV